MQRKPGGYRSPSVHTRVLSVISAENYQKWFQQVWNGVTGASTKEHPAPYPMELAERLVRMFSFVGDTMLDPFMGTGTTNAAAGRWGRNSIGIEVDPEYFGMSEQRVRKVMRQYDAGQVVAHGDTSRGEEVCSILNRNSASPFAT